jgi:transposase
LRARRFAEEDLARTKTDAIDALGIARFAAQKHPAPTALPEPAVEHLRELVRLREQTVLQLGDRVRHLHALASYVDVVPRLHQSGTRRFSGRVAIPLGNARLRRALWMPVLVAVRLNPWLHAYYWRLRRAGKRPKVAMIACMHKLLAAVYSVAKNRRPFLPKLSPPIEA